jgi:chemotaxis protein CheC
MNQLTPEGTVALEKMAQDGADKASLALSQLIGQHIGVEAVAVREVPLEHVVGTIGNPEDLVSSIAMDISGDLYGSVILIYPQQSAHNIADLLMKHPLGSTRELGDQECSALKESGNIISGAFLSALSNYLSLNMLESIPDLASDMLKATLDAALAKFAVDEVGDAVALTVRFSMSTDEGAATGIVPTIVINAFFVLLLDGASTRKLLASLSRISGGDEMTV